MIVYAPSYAGLVQAIKICPIKEITVITNHNNIVDFCEKLNIRCERVNWNRKGGIFNTLSAKKEIKKDSAAIKGKKILFCFYGFDIHGLYFLYQLAEKNQILFHNKDHIFKKEKSILILFDKFRNKDFLIYLLIFRISISSFIISERKFFGITPKKLKKDFGSINESYNKDIFELNRRICCNNINFGEKPVIFVDQGKKRFNVPDRVIKLLENKFKDNSIFLKAHPNGELSNPKLLKFNQLPRYIPIELILNENCITVSICSTSLLDDDLECARFSLINQVEWHSIEDKRKYLELVKRHSQITII